jgi:hypothetical protein
MPGVALAGTSAVTLNHSLVNLVLFTVPTWRNPEVKDKKNKVQA